MKYVVILLVCLSTVAFAQKRSKVIDFEGEVVEGINKKSFDSFSQLSEGQSRKKRSHLYRYRAGYKTENRQMIEEVRMVQ